MRVLLTFAFFALFPLLASATTITSGTIVLPYGPVARSFDFSGPGFSVSGTFGGGVALAGPLVALVIHAHRRFQQWSAGSSLAVIYSPGAPL